MTSTRRMTPRFRLYADAYMLQPGSCLVDNDSGARLFRSGDSFRMVAANGSEHKLLIAATDADRLWAHWRGFAGIEERERDWAAAKAAR